MERLIDHGSMPVAGYATPWAVRGGQRVSLHLSTAAPVEKLSAMRLDLPESASIDWPIKITDTEPEHRALDQGSYLHVPAEEQAKAGAVEGVHIALFLTRNSGVRTILDTGVLALELEDGAISLRCNDDVLLGPQPVPARTWLSISLHRDGGPPGRVICRLRAPG
jgi:N,N-dimethylformamidase